MPGPCVRKHYNPHGESILSEIRSKTAPNHDFGQHRQESVISDSRVVDEWPGSRLIMDAYQPY